MPSKKKKGASTSKPSIKPGRVNKAAGVSKKTRDFYIVGLGASAGGLEAFEKFFRNMPNDSGMAFILVPHLDPTHVSLMPELIQKSSKMDVIQVKDGTAVKPNAVYIVPPNHDLAILNGTLQLFAPQKIPGPRMPIDYFFRSLAEDRGEKAICIILSGMGTDGTLGLRAIKGELGMAMVQSVESAKYNSMPRSAIETELVDYILPPEKMSEQLIAYEQHATQKKAAPKLMDGEGKLPDALQKIFILLRTHTGHDFSAYKKNTICRRIERRMNVHQIDKISTYVRYLQENVIEVDTLFKELLIGVTNFFRDGEAFETLKKKALSQLLEGKPEDYVIRAWVPGCSSGEEAYSLAIMLRECAEQLKKHVGIQIFATDIDNNAIETARAGIYPASISVDVSPDRLKRFFISEDNICRIKKNIREMLVFAPQDIIKDPPFTKLDMVCCRNLLIYLASELQKKILPLFHYSLKQDGILFLGSSETIGGFTDLFSPVDKKWKIFRRKKAVSTAHVAVEVPVTAPMDRIDEVEEVKPAEVSVTQLAEKTLMEFYAPPSVIINQKGDILYIHGRTGKYLEPAQGEARWNIYDMAREGLKLELPTAIRKAFTQKREVIYKELQVNYNGGTQAMNLTVRPVGKPELVPGLLMVVFEDVSPPSQEEPPRKKQMSKKKGDEKIEALDKELRYTKENLQTTIEKWETSNEELKSTNEELQSTNEELQSTNEELQTSKEEQQSLNEELATVNSELQGKIDGLSTANNDLKNLIDCINVPAIFLDNDLCIKRFTSPVTKIINLIPSDIDRPISDIVTKIKQGDLIEHSKAVLRDLMSRSKEVQIEDGAWYTLRTMPYRTTDNVIDGVVLTFTDLSKENERRLATVVRDSSDAITVQDFNGKIIAWNRGAENMYGYTEEEALKMNITDILPDEYRTELTTVVKTIEKEDSVKSFKTRRITKDGKPIDVWFTATALVDDTGKPVELATTERDLSSLEQIKQT